MKIEKIKPIPKYMLELIHREDRKRYDKQCGYVRFYSYLTKNDKELVRVIVAVKNRYKKWYCKQVVVHGVHTKFCFAKDINCYYIAGHVVGWYEQGLQKYRKWWESENWYEYDDKYFSPYAPILNLDYLKKFPEYRYSGAENYKYDNLFKLLRLYEQYPQAEYLMKLGLQLYATSVIILKKIAKDKPFRKWLISHCTEIKGNDYYVSTLLKAYKENRPLDVVEKQERLMKSFCKSSHYIRIKGLFPNICDFAEYLTKQHTNESSYMDYLNACEQLNLDMTLPKNKTPHDFWYWHNIRIDEYHTAKAIIDKKKRAKLYEQFKIVAQKYLPLQRNLNDAFIVIIAKSPADLIREGGFLHHCVGYMNYDQRMIREESLIFFIRKALEPDVPFVTVEYSVAKRKILQCYGYEDRMPNNEVSNFVNKVWLPYANRKINKILKVATAA